MWTWKVRLFFGVVLTLFFLTVGTLWVAIGRLQDQAARFRAVELSTRDSLCIQREQALTSHQRTPAEKRKRVAEIDRALARIHGVC